MKTAAKLIGLGFGAYKLAKAVSRQFRKMDFKNRVVVITGGSRGLGLVLARQFATEGARLALIARDEIELVKVKQELQQSGASVETFACDVRDQFQVHETIQSVMQEMGKIDVLVNNAGVIEVGPFEEMDVEDFRNAMETHFWGPLHTALEVIPAMRARGEGRIVNISSVGGKIAVPHLLPYAASKFALAGFSEGLRAELMKDNILVTTVCPGMMRTGSHIQAKFKGQNDLEYAWFTVLNSLPVMSIAAPDAAKKIIDACKFGDGQLVLTTPAQVAVQMKEFVPDLFTDAMGTINRYMPGAGGIGREKKFGNESKSKYAPAILTVLSDSATKKNNETTSFSH